MFSDLISNCKDFISDPNYFNKNGNKQFRIDFICQNINLNEIMKYACKKALKCVKNETKIDTIELTQVFSNFYCHCLTNSHAKKIVEKLNKIIIKSVYGGESFVQAYQLRSKYHLKLNLIDEALYDINVAIKYGGLDTERILIKCLTFFHKKDFKRLSVLMNLIANVYFFDDKLIKKYNILGCKPVTMKDLQDSIKNVNDLNFLQSLEEPSYIKSLLKFETNYELDPRCQIVSDKVKGRHFMCKEFIPQGTKLLVERAYSLVLEENVQHEMCLYCNKDCGIKSLPCRYCFDAVFCSEECFQRAWRIFHRHECLIIPLFNDYTKVALHMYRTISRIGFRKAIAIKKELDQLKKNQNIRNNANKSGKSVDQYINDFIIEEYLSDEQLRNTVDFKQSEEQKTLTYEMLLTLLDHNDKFESYYDANFMELAIGVSLLLLLNDYLIDQSWQTDLPHWKTLDWDSLEKIFFENQNRKNLNEYNMFNHSYGDFLILVEIILINIRKLSTNVFSWNRYSEDNSSKKNLATCECLIGSLINHSCDPNVDWEFQNGCIVYTTVKDINAGDEINNSYGPYMELPFIERQSYLANSYYFNCHCRACQCDAETYSDVLECKKCGGPVVVIANSNIDADCMYCCNIYLQAQHTMKIVNDHRNNFQAFLHYYSNVNQELSLVKQMKESIDFQRKYLYKQNIDLHRNMFRLCKIFFQNNMLDFDDYYGEFSFTKEHNQPKDDLFQAIQNCILQFDIGLKYFSDICSKDQIQSTELILKRGRFIKDCYYEFKVIMGLLLSEYSKLTNGQLNQEIFDDIFHGIRKKYGTMIKICCSLE